MAKNGNNRQLHSISEKTGQSQTNTNRKNKNQLLLGDGTYSKESGKKSREFYPDQYIGFVDPVKEKSINPYTANEIARDFSLAIFMLEALPQDIDLKPLSDNLDENLAYIRQVFYDYCAKNELEAICDNKVLLYKPITDCNEWCHINFSNVVISARDIGPEHENLMLQCIAIMVHCFGFRTWDDCIEGEMIADWVLSSIDEDNPDPGLVEEYETIMGTYGNSQIADWWIQEILEQTTDIEEIKSLINSIKMDGNEYSYRLCEFAIDVIWLYENNFSLNNYSIYSDSDQRLTDGICDLLIGLDSIFFFDFEEFHDMSGQKQEWVNDSFANNEESIKYYCRYPLKNTENFEQIKINKFEDICTALIDLGTKKNRNECLTYK